MSTQPPTLDYSSGGPPRPPLPDDRPLSHACVAALGVAVLMSPPLYCAWISVLAQTIDRGAWWGVLKAAPWWAVAVGVLRLIAAGRAELVQKRGARWALTGFVLSLVNAAFCRWALEEIAASV